MKQIFLIAVLFYCAKVSAQVGIGTNTPNANALLELKSTTKGFLPPRLTPAERSTLGLSLNTSTIGMVVLDSATGSPYIWNGGSFTNYAAPTGVYPISVNSANQVSLTAQTDIQPYLAMTYCIALEGIFPSRSGEYPFVGEIELFAFNFAPVGWALCNGQTMAISQNTALFSLIGTYYGGNGTTTFQLPNLQSRVPVGMGQGLGLSLYNLGQTGGMETIQ